MKKNDIILALKGMGISDQLDTGPTAIIVSSGNKRRKVLLKIKKENDSIFITSGKIFKRTLRIKTDDL